MTTATITATIDSFMDAVVSADNFGSLERVETTSLFAGETKLAIDRAIGNFDLSTVPPTATIDSAKLVQDIYLVQAGSRAAAVYRCTRPDQWTELGVTWQDYDAPADWTDAGGDFTETDKVTFTFPASTGEFSITGLKTLVDDARANRNDILAVIIKFDLEGENDGNDRYIWRSSEYATEAERWRLIVDYTLPLPPDAGRRSVPRSSFGERARSSRPAAPARAGAGARTARPSRPAIRRPR